MVDGRREVWNFVAADVLVVVGHDRVVGPAAGRREIVAAGIVVRLRTRRALLLGAMAGTHIVPDLVRHRVAVHHRLDGARAVGAGSEGGGIARVMERKARARRAVGAAGVDQHADDVRPDLVALVVHQAEIEAVLRRIAPTDA